MEEREKQTPSIWDLLEILDIRQVGDGDDDIRLVLARTPRGKLIVIRTTDPRISPTSPPEGKENPNP